jgi:hypothetical protein
VINLGVLEDPELLSHFFLHYFTLKLVLDIRQISCNLLLYDIYITLVNHGKLTFSLTFD